LVIVFLAVAVRWRYLAQSAAPFNDGGLFYAMIKTPYTGPTMLWNGYALPRAYPPLSFTLLGLLAERFDLMQLMRVWPLTWSLLAIGAFYLLARQAVPAAAAWATLAFGLMPDAFLWQIMGGGVSRAPGYALAIAAWAAAYGLKPSKRIISAVGVGVLAALAVLTHPDAGLFAVVGCVALLAARRASFRQVAVTAAPAVVIGATILLWHNGAGLNALQTGDHDLAVAVARLVAAIDKQGPLAAVCLLWIILQRRTGLAVALVVLALVSPRSGERWMVVPLALGAGEALHAVATSIRLRSLPRAAALGIVLLVAAQCIAAVVLQIDSLSQADLAAMQWVKANTPAGARFIVISGQTWAIDPVAEWFPALAERESVNTPQGTEWLPCGEFERRKVLYAQVAMCAAQECLPVHDYIFFGERGRAALFAALRGYREVYAAGGVFILEKGR
jgi:hypothetical protein